VHHRTIQINHQPDATVFQFIILTFTYIPTCFGRFPAHYQELNDCSSSLWFYLHIVVTLVLCSWLGRSARPRTQHDYHHDTKVKPEAANAVIELLTMGGKTSGTCWTVSKRQDNKLENCCIWLVVYLNRIVMFFTLDTGCVRSSWHRKITDSSPTSTMMMKAEDSSETSVHIYELYGVGTQTIIIRCKSTCLKFHAMHDTCNFFPSIFQCLVSIFHSDKTFFQGQALSWNIWLVCIRSFLIDVPNYI